MCSNAAVEWMGSRVDQSLESTSMPSTPSSVCRARRLRAYCAGDGAAYCGIRLECTVVYLSGDGALALDIQKGYPKRVYRKDMQLGGRCPEMDGHWRRRGEEREIQGFGLRKRRKGVV
jgi:hypothetical protein